MGSSACRPLGYGIQRGMIPNYRDSLDYYFLPSLRDIHVSSIKKNDQNKAIESLEFFIIDKLKH